MPRDAFGNYSLPRAPFVSGQIIKSADVNADLADIASALTASATVAGLTAAIGGVNAKFVHVADFGAVGDGTTDDTAAIQTAINSLSGTGGILWFAPKPYKITAALTVPATIIFQGAGFQEGPQDQTTTPVRPSRGTWFLHTNPAAPLFSLTTANAQSSRFRDFAVWQTHPTIAPGWAPTVYQPVFYINAVGGTTGFDNIHLHNCYDGIYVMDSGRIDATHIQGQVFRRFLDADRCYDKLHFSYVDLWQYWSAKDDVMAWMQANTVSFYVQRVDGIFVNNIFSAVAKVIFQFVTSASGAATRWMIGNIYGDFCSSAIQVDCSNITGFVNKIVVLTEKWNSGGLALPGGMPILVNGSGNKLHFGHLELANCETSAMRIRGTGNAVQIDQLQVTLYNQSNTGAPVILTDAGTPGNVVWVASEPQLSSSFPTTLGSNTGNSLTVRLPMVNMNGAAVNYPVFGGAPSGGTVSLTVTGPDTNIPLIVSAKGNANLTLFNGNGTCAVFGAPSSAVVYPLISSNTTGAAAVYSAGGETNTSVILQGQGTGGAILGSSGGKVAFFGAAPVTRTALPGAASDPATTQALANAIRAALINMGLTT